MFDSKVSKKPKIGEQPAPTQDNKVVPMRQIVIETDGNNIKIVKNETTTLEFRQILALLYQQLFNQPPKQ